MRDVLDTALRARGRGSQTWLAGQLNVRPQTVNKWVKGQTTPEMERWAEIESALELDDGTLARASGMHDIMIKATGDIAAIERTRVTLPGAPDPGDDIDRELLDEIGRLGDVVQLLEDRIQDLERRLDRTVPRPVDEAREAAQS